MTLTVEPPPVEALDAGVIEEARARQRRHRGIAAAATVVAAGIAAIGLAAGGGGGSAHAAQGSVPPARPPLKTAPLSAAACVAGQTTTTGKPSRSLLAILGVLRRPPALADALPPRLEQGLTRRPMGGWQVFVNYIRRARVVSGSSYYVYPVRLATCGLLARSGTGIVLMNKCGLGSTASGGATATQIETGAMFSYGGGCARSLDSSLVSGIVPDGVATVTLHYPAGRVGGYSRKMAHAATVTTRPVNNVVVVTVPRGGGNGDSWRTMTWRAANGTVIKTIPGGP